MHQHSMFFCFLFFLSIVNGMENIEQKLKYDFKNLEKNRFHIFFFQFLVSFRQLMKFTNTLAFTTRRIQTLNNSY